VKPCRGPGTGPPGVPRQLPRELTSRCWSRLTFPAVIGRARGESAHHRDRTSCPRSSPAVPPARRLRATGTWPKPYWGQPLLLRHHVRRPARRPAVATCQSAGMTCPSPAEAVEDSARKWADGRQPSRAPADLGPRPRTRIFDLLFGTVQHQAVPRTELHRLNDGEAEFLAEPAATFVMPASPGLPGLHHLSLSSTPPTRTQSPSSGGA